MIQTTPTQINGQAAMSVTGLPADGEPMTLADWHELARHIVYATHDAQMMPDHPMTPNVWMPRTVEVPVGIDSEGGSHD